MTALVWHWYEVVEGCVASAVVSVALVLLPVLHRMRKHRIRAEERHVEHMAALDPRSPGGIGDVALPLKKKDGV